MTGDRLTSRIAAAFVLALLTACGTTTATQTPAPDHSAEIAALKSYFAEDFSCTRGQAQAIDLKNLKQNPSVFLDKCVHVKAYADDRRLRTDAGDEPRSERESFAQIGVNWKDESTRKRLGLAPSFVDVIGRVRNCKQQYSRTQALLNFTAPPNGPPPNIAMLSGGCHYFATAIFVSEVQIVPTAMD